MTDYKLDANKSFHIAGEKKGTSTDTVSTPELLCQDCTQYDTRRGGNCQKKSSEMHILRPLGNNVSAKVKSWRRVKYDANRLREFMKAKNFEGHWPDAYAIHHTQVSRHPKDFFVVNEEIRKKFGSWCVVNPRILRRSEESVFPEGCMSFMFREMKKVDRWAHITVFYWTPLFNLILIPRIRKFKNIEAYVFQHEIDHANGINIYGI